MIYDPKSVWFRSWLVDGPVTRVAVNQHGAPKTTAARQIAAPSVHATSA